MSKYTVIFEESQLIKKQLKKLIKNKKLYARLKEILLEMTVNPYNPTFMFERLKGDKSGRCSKRLTQKDRIYYQVKDEIVTVFVISIEGHYDDR